MLIGYEKGESVATNMCIKSSLCHTIYLFKFFILSLELSPPIVSPNLFQSTQMRPRPGQREVQIS